MKNKFQQELSVFEKGQLPQGASDNAQRTGAEPNRVYHSTTENTGGHKNDIGVVQPTDIRDAEHAWISYRDAWFTKERICTFDGDHAGRKP